MKISECKQLLSERLGKVPLVDPQHIPSLPDPLEALPQLLGLAGLEEYQETWSLDSETALALRRIYSVTAEQIRSERVWDEDDPCASLHG